MSDKQQQMALSVSLPDDETFESFYQAEPLLIKKLQQFIGTDVVSCCVLFGQQGVGKSHLLHACSNYAEQQQFSTLCLSAEQMLAMPVSLLDGLEQIQLICIDDIQLLASSSAWQQAVFDLYNRVLEHGNKLLFSANAPVAELALSLPDLKSRLSWGWVEPVKLLADEDKLKALQLRAKLRGLVLTDEVGRFLLARHQRGMAPLMLALQKLDEASMREQRKITIPFVKSILLID